MPEKAKSLYPADVIKQEVPTLGRRKKIVPGRGKERGSSRGEPQEGFPLHVP